MFNLSDSLGRPLFANIQVRATATRLASACSSDAPHPTPKDQPCLRCLPEDRRARKVSLRSNPRCCSPFPQPQPLSFRRCTHKLAEVWNHEALGKASTSFTHPFCSPASQMPRWLSSNKMEIVKGILAGAHTCSRAGPQTPSLYVHKTDLPPSVAQMIRPCCTLALLTRPAHTPSLMPRARTQSPRVDGSGLRRHAQGLPVAPRRRLLQPAARWRHQSAHRL